MLLQSPIRLPSHPLESAEAVQLRRDSAEQKQQDIARSLGGTRRSSIADQAAVVHFGSRALGLARSQPPPSDPSLSDANDAESAAREPERAPGASDAATAAAPASSSPLAASDDPSAAEPDDADDEQTQTDELKHRDREVRAHEQAHKAAGGSYAGSVRLTYQMGADGKRYAVEGEVPIDVSPVAGDPAATLRKMEVVARAARAPASPSGADQGVAAQATRMMQQARAQLAAERYARTRELVPG
jgi:hypothetical protein